MTTKTKDCEIDFESLVLKPGAHSAKQGEYCLLEAVACYAGERHSDHPKSVSPVIASFGRRWNDALNDTDRQMLKPYVFTVIGTNTGKADDERRAWMCTDWLVRTFVPAWLDLAKLTDHAARLRALPELTSTELANAALPIIRDALRASAAAWDAAGDAAWDAAGDAAGDAAWDAARAAAWAAARDAAWAAAGDAAGAAAWAAAWAAARAAAGAAAWAAARAAAGDAAWAAARAAAGDAAGDAAWDAARAAARDVLKPTVASLQASALQLLDRMIEVGKVTM